MEKQKQQHINKNAKKKVNENNTKRNGNCGTAAGKLWGIIKISYKILKE